MSITEDAAQGLDAITEIITLLAPLGKEARLLILKHAMEWVEHSERKRLQEEQAA